MAKLDLFEISKMKGIEELTLNEVVKCNGGESLWYWVAYGVGAAGRAIKYLSNKHTEMVMEQGGHAAVMPFK